MTRALRVLLWVLATLLAALLLLETSLQLAAVLTKEQSRQVESRWLTSGTRILALGDSNTYGFYLSAEQAWPAQLAQQWNAAHPDQPVELLNLGYPGSNSFRLRDNLPALLDTLAPDLVLIMVGFNDFWTPPEQLTANPDDSLVARFKHHSRLYRLYSIATRSQLAPEAVQFGASRNPLDPVDTANPEQHLLHINGDAFYLGTRAGEPARQRDALPDNLAAMIAAARARGTAIALMTYPSNWGFYPGANKRISLTATAQAVPLIDITPLFIERCQHGPPSCPELLFHDGHATAAGNALVATSVMPFLHKQFASVQNRR